MVRKLILKVISIAISLGVGLPLIFFLLMYNGFFGSIPDEEAIRNIENLEASVVYDVKGEALGKFYIQDRTLVTMDQISPFLVNALVATEDRRYYSHHGIDFKSLLRVAVKTVLLQKSSSGGGSTITLQLAKNLFPRSPYKLLYYPINKTREAIVAYRMEKYYSKDEILTLYLNTVSFGEDVFGVEAAAQRFFSSSAADLRPEQSAVLVGMLKATTSYNPVLHQEASLSRRNVVLSQMVKADILAEAMADSLSALDIGVQYQPAIKEVGAYFMTQVRHKTEQFIKDYNAETKEKINLLTDGLKIYTTIDRQLQEYAEKAMYEHMFKLQQVFDKHWHDKDLWSRHKKLLDREIKKVANGRSPLQMQQKRDMFIYQVEGDDFANMSPIDSIKYYLQQLQAGFLAIQPQNGAIKSWVGGIDFQFFPYDHVNYSAKRQVGSTFKPIVYAAALEKGISPCNYYKATQASYDEQGKEWSPANDDASYEGKYTMEGALEGSVNTVSVKILNDVGIENTIELAHEMGISSTIPAVPSIALGTPSISLIEMVTAYAAFVNGGYAVNPYMIDRIEDREGKILYQHQPSKKRRILSEKTSRVMVHLLEGVVDDGTGRSVRTIYQVKGHVGGKTGTTQNNADGWFIGITPKLVAGAWVGGIYPEISFTETRLGQGATMALPIFAKFYKNLGADTNYRSYSQSQFKPMQAAWADELECDPFKEDFKLFEWIFGNKKGNNKDKKEKSKEKKSKEKKGVFQKLKGLFKKN
jgi:penicillin-binding protein 1A